MNRASKYLSRRIFFVTDNDQPELSQTGRMASITRAKDLGNIGVNFLPFFITKDSIFDSSIFYEVCFSLYVLLVHQLTLSLGFTLRYSDN